MSEEKRRPAAFRIDAEPARPQPAANAAPSPAPTSVREPKTAPRSPRAVRADEPVVVAEAVDVFDAADDALAVPPMPMPRKKRSRLGSIFFAALGALVSLSLGLWLDALIRDLFARADWLGWLAAGVTAIAVLALVGIVGRELLGLRRLASVEHMQRKAEDVAQRNDQPGAHALVAELSTFLAARPETAAGRRSLEALRDDVIDGRDLVGLAETELLSPLDARARQLVLDAAKRVSLVTAVSPRALVDIAYVAFEASRLIRRLAELYGARPGTIGFFRLIRSVLSHLAVTGTIAAGDSVVQQLIGQGLAARLSAKLGEGVVNGMMTARIGLAAIEAVRPLPFRAVRRPGLGDILAVLTQFSGRGTKDTAPAD